MVYSKEHWFRQAENATFQLGAEDKGVFTWGKQSWLVQTIKMPTLQLPQKGWDGMVIY